MISKYSRSFFRFTWSATEPKNIAKITPQSIFLPPDDSKYKIKWQIVENYNASKMILQDGWLQALRAIVLFAFLWSGELSSFHYSVQS